MKTSKKFLYKTLFKSILKDLVFYTFSSFLFCFLIINFIIYSLHAHSSLTTGLWVSYLFSQFVTMLPILLSLSFVLASIFIAYLKRTSFEFLALFTSGIPKKIVIFPFFIFSLLLSSLLFVNDHFFTSDAQKFLSEIKPKLVSHKKRLNKEKITILHLDDCKIIYHDFDIENQKIHDLYVIESPEKIWHFESYFLKDQLAKNIDLIEEKDGYLTKTETLEEKSFFIDPKLFTLNSIPLNKIHLSSLLSLQKESFFSKEKKEMIRIQIYQKMLYLLFPVLLSLLFFSFLLKSFKRKFLLDAGIVSLLFFGFYFLVHLFSSLAEVRVFSANILFCIPIIYITIAYGQKALFRN